MRRMLGTVSTPAAAQGALQQGEGTARAKHRTCLCCDRARERPRESRVLEMTWIPLEDELEALLLSFLTPWFLR